MALFGTVSSDIHFRNRIINGDMRIDQRNNGASISLSTSLVYAVDRFGAETNVGSGHTIEQVQDVPVGFTDSYKLTVGTGATPTGTNYGRLRQWIEGNNIADLGFGSANAKTITVSFWVKSSVTGTYGVAVSNGSNARSYIATYTINSANTWEQKTVTLDGDTTGTWATNNTAGIGLAWDLGEGPDRSKAAGSWGAAAGSGYGLTSGTKILATTGATFFITGVQLEAGAVATPFERRPFGTELALCQRYYESSAFPSATFSQGSTTALSVFVTNTDRAAGIKFTCVKRAAPTVVIYSRNNNAGKVSIVSSGADNTGNASATLISETGWSNTFIGANATAGVGVEVGYTASAEL